jgi:hypothetical protein
MVIANNFSITTIFNVKAEITHIILILYVYFTIIVKSKVYERRIF